MNVALLGASQKPDRYAYLALKLLEQHGHRVFLVNPLLKDVEGRVVYPNLAAVPEAVNTLTLYVGSGKVGAAQEEILALKPRRVIFNPGTENAAVERALQAAGIEATEACTLVLLRTAQF